MMASPTSPMQVLIVLTIVSSCTACWRTPQNTAVFEGATTEFVCEVAHVGVKFAKWSIHHATKANKGFDIVGRPSRAIRLPDAYSVEPHGMYSVSYNYIRADDVKMFELRIRNVTKGDGQLQFACSLWNRTSKLIQGDFKDLTVWSLPKPTCSFEPINVPDVIPSTGIEINLVCFVSDNDSPPVALSWYTNGRQISREQNGTNAFSYLLTSSDIGRNFTCKTNIETELESPSCTVTPFNKVPALTTASTTTLIHDEISTASVSNKSLVSTISSENFILTVSDKNSTFRVFNETSRFDETSRFTDSGESFTLAAPEKVTEQRREADYRYGITSTVTCAIVLLFVVNVCIAFYCSRKRKDVSNDAENKINSKALHPKNTYQMETLSEPVYEHISDPVESCTNFYHHIEDQGQSHQLYDSIDTNQYMKGRNINKVLPSNHAADSNWYQALQTDQVRKDQSDPSAYTGLKASTFPGRSVIISDSYLYETVQTLN